MTVEIAAVIVLSGIVIAQQFLIAQLSGKLMARDFSEWVMGKKALKAAPPEKRDPTPFVDDYAAGQAAKANQVFRI